MIQNDFLMRLIEKMSAAFFNLVAGKSSVPEETTASDIERLLSESLNANPLFLFSHLDAVLDGCDPRLAFQIARLLVLHGENVQDEAKASRSFSYAVNFAGAALPATHHGPELRSLLETLKERVPVPPAVLDRWADAELEAGEIAMAEDRFVGAIVVEPSTDRFDRARAFYDRLDSMTDAELAEGNFSRQEIDEGRAYLTSLETP